MSQLSLVRKWPAVVTVVGVCVLTFAGLAAAVGGNESTVPEPVAITAPDTPTPAPARVKAKKTLKDLMADQGSRGAVDRSTDHPAGTSVVTQPPAAGGAASGSLERAVGRMIMTGYTGVYPSADTLRRARTGQIGGVILMGENVGAQTPAAISALQAAAVAGTGHRLVVATDQEGGTVKRFPQVGPYLPASRIGPATARAQGAATGKGLASVGVNTDLAPVADVGHAGSFMGTRAFASTPSGTAQSACRFMQGLNDGGVNATLKHFPGLGYAVKNTDFAASRVTASAAALRADLLPYTSCRPQLVMVSNASYPALGSPGPAVFSSELINGLLRGQLGFSGVVISDSLTATSVTSPTTAVRAVQAGVDMLLYIDPAISALAYQKVLGAARSGQIPRANVRASASRIAELTRR